MGKHIDIWDWKSEEDRQKWMQENPIREMVIQMNNAEPEEAEKLQQKSLEGSEDG
jgi:hypothetical protein